MSNIIQILQNYCANIVPILQKYWANIVQVLHKCCANIEQILKNYWANIVQLLCKYCTKCCVNIVQNVVRILFKYCENIREKKLQGVPKYCVHFVLGDLWAREASIIFLNGRIIQQIKFWVEKCIKRPLSLLSKLRYSNFKIKGAFLKVTKLELELAKFLICWSVQLLLLTAV